MTEAAHLPAQYQNVDGLWSREWFLQRARAFGPATVEVIGQVIDRRALEAQGFLDCRNILDSLGKNNKLRLEAACQQILSTGGHPTYTTIKRIMAAIDSDAKKPARVRPAASTRKRPAFEAAAGEAATPDESPSGAYIRGADYYRQLGERRTF
ncbi:hypothetical protein JOF28_000062 [Leucobacter exalbidus]|uniref:Uncharacterized protein n=1 Tax=Leucobacter exalbidus TaxID=662960 RepID=A0A940PRD4_9MICO|nr:hypothetical protein [Leucobacter exalbidus]MBP1324830.1 hypothetical protein [Leucobacter exalbidus]